MTEPIHKIRMVLMEIGLAIGVTSIFAAHPFFAAGAWPSSETMFVAVLAGAALCCVGINVQTISSPLVFIPLVIAAWGALTAPFSTFPRTSLLGAPQNGLGVAWFAIQASFTAAALNLREQPSSLSRVCVVAAAATAMSAFFSLGNVPLLTQYVPSMPAVLFSFNEHLAYPALALAAIAAVRLSDRRWIYGTIFMVIAVIILAMSRNRTAMAAFVVLAPLVAIVELSAIGSTLRIWINRHPKRSVIILVLAIVTTGLAPYLVIRLSDLTGAPFSIYSRQILFKVLEPTLFDKLSGLLTGHGWGHYQEYLVRNLPATGIRLFDSEWGDMTHDEFHSHNSLLEALFSAGIPGLGLVLAFSAAIPIAAGTRWKFIATGLVLAWSVIDSMWFALPSSLAIQAIAIATLAGQTTTLRKSRTIACLAIIIGLTMAGCAVWLRYQSIGIETIRTCLSAEQSSKSCLSMVIPTDPRGSDIGLAVLLSEFHDRPAMPLLSTVIKTAQARCREGCALPLSMQLVNLYASKAFAIPQADDFSDVAWQEETLRVVASAPLRLDILIPYLDWLLTVHDDARVQDILIEVAKSNSNHPVFLWFSGVALLGDGNIYGESKGLEQMRLALEAGVERFMPVEPDLKAALSREHP